MSFTVEWSRRALRDLHAIHAYIAADSPRAAQRTAAELADSLAEMPGRAGAWVRTFANWSRGGICCAT